MVKHGKYGIFKGEEYRLVKIQGDTAELVSHNSYDAYKGFIPYEQDDTIYIKKIYTSHLEFAYRVMTFALYKGHKLGVVSDKGDTFLLGTTDTKAWRDLGMQVINKFEYHIEVPKNQVELVEVKTPILGFQLNL
ncbi:hypothetical protein [Bacillus sp. 165]|uniref:hypothetical protein n=1 Tax=Bacillus sp. 165 TaxID=1529117 RepID=UPI001ADC495A|nr:hypothetical protein [Bacillus sp. 165]MBO9129008.1 hypothetical protein [Bacillus sp. 165]